MKLHMLAGAAFSLLVCTVAAQSSLPQVDLGYEIHQAISLNETGQTYNFSNIRYAQPPVGNLRFAPPLPPTGRNTVVNNGSVGVICPQATPAWEAITETYALYIVNGTYNTFNYTQALLELEAEIASAPPSTPDPRTTEDCLFLDVIVPKAVFDNANNKHRRRSGAGAPVLLWIYGGGYTEGSKGGSGNPSGLIEASQAAGGQGIVFVEINYRLGAMGWLAGPTLQEEGGTSNAALYDQRLAIEWVKQNIHLFGGDPNQITLLGESAGGGSIMHQVTAFGGQQGVSFQRAIMQSPGFLNIPQQSTQENTTQTFLALLNVTTIAEARNASSEAIIAANAKQVLASAYGDFTYGPVVDGVFAPALPGILLGAGAFAKNISVMVGHNADEGALFTPPYITTEPLFAEFIQSVAPGIQPAELDYLTDVLYPANYSGAYGYVDVQTKVFTFISDSTFVCNTNYLDKAFNGTTYAYEFEVPPAFHGFDIPYTFYDGTGTNLSADLIAPVAQALQGFITNFAQTGNPNGPGLPTFPMWGSNATLMGLNYTGLTLQTDPTNNARCAWWQKALYN